MEENRIEDIRNIPNSINVNFFISTDLQVSRGIGINSSPVLSLLPINYANQGQAFFHNPAAFDPDGDSISYHLTVPKQAVGVDVNDYLSPHNNSSIEIPKALIMWRWKSENSEKFKGNSYC